MCGAACAVWLVPVTASGQDRSPRPHVALVVGNADYLYTDALANPVVDATLIRRRLEQAGFDVHFVINAGREEMRDAIAAFRHRLSSLSDAAVGLVYYAGHGVQIDGVNFLIPVDAQLSSEQGFVEKDGINAGDILAEPAGQHDRPRLNVIILDACRDNPFRKPAAAGPPGYGRTSAGGLARMDAPRGSYIAFSTEPGNVALDGAGGNSPFAEALAEVMTRPGLKLEEVFKEVRRKVHAATEGRQTPWDSSSAFGDFYFIPPTTAQREAMARVDPEKEQERQAAEAKALDGPRLVRGLQEELIRVGCFGGQVDGVFSQTTVGALRNWILRTNERVYWHRPTAAALTALKASRPAVCDTRCGGRGTRDDAACSFAGASPREKCFSIGKERFCE